jgi:hypothetical protein
MVQLQKIIKIREEEEEEPGMLFKAETLSSSCLALEEQGIVQEVVVPACQLIKRETLAISLGVVVVEQANQQAFYKHYPEGQALMGGS